MTTPGSMKLQNPPTGKHKLVNRETGIGESQSGYKVVAKSGHAHSASFQRKHDTNFQPSKLTGRNSQGTNTGNTGETVEIDNLDGLTSFIETLGNAAAEIVNIHVKEGNFSLKISPDPSGVFSVEASNSNKSFSAKIDPKNDSDFELINPDDCDISSTHKENGANPNDDDDDDCQLTSKEKREILRLRQEKSKLREKEKKLTNLDLRQKKFLHSKKDSNKENSAKTSSDRSHGDVEKNESQSADENCDCGEDSCNSDSHGSETISGGKWLWSIDELIREIKKTFNPVFSDAKSSFTLHKECYAYHKKCYAYCGDKKRDIYKGKDGIEIGGRSNLDSGFNYALNSDPSSDSNPSDSNLIFGPGDSNLISNPSGTKFDSSEEQSVKPNHDSDSGDINSDPSQNSDGDNGSEINEVEEPSERINELCEKFDGENPSVEDRVEINGGDKLYSKVFEKVKEDLIFYCNICKEAREKIERDEDSDEAKVNLAASQKNLRSLNESIFLLLEKIRAFPGDESFGAENKIVPKLLELQDVAFSQIDACEYLERLKYDTEMEAFAFESKFKSIASSDHLTMASDLVDLSGKVEEYLQKTYEAIDRDREEHGFSANELNALKSWVIGDSIKKLLKKILESLLAAICDYEKSMEEEMKKIEEEYKALSSGGGNTDVFSSIEKVQNFLTEIADKINQKEEQIKNLTEKFEVLRKKFNSENKVISDSEAIFEKMKKDVEKLREKEQNVVQFKPFQMTTCCFSDNSSVQQKCDMLKIALNSAVDKFHENENRTMNLCFRAGITIDSGRGSEEVTLLGKISGDGQNQMFTLGNGEFEFQFAWNDGKGMDENVANFIIDLLKARGNKLQNLQTDTSTSTLGGAGKLPTVSLLSDKKRDDKIRISLETGITNIKSTLNTLRSGSKSQSKNVSYLQLNCEWKVNGIDLLVTMHKTEKTTICIRRKDGYGGEIKFTWNRGEGLAKEKVLEKILALVNSISTISSEVNGVGVQIFMEKTNAGTKGSITRNDGRGGKVDFSFDGNEGIGGGAAKSILDLCKNKAPRVSRISNFHGRSVAIVREKLKEISTQKSSFNGTWQLFYPDDFQVKFDVYYNADTKTRIVSIDNEIEKFRFVLGDSGNPGDDVVEHILYMIYDAKKISDLEENVEEVIDQMHSVILAHSGKDFTQEDEYGAILDGSTQLVSVLLQLRDLDRLYSTKGTDHDQNSQQYLKKIRKIAAEATSFLRDKNPLTPGYMVSNFMEISSYLEKLHLIRDRTRATNENLAEINRLSKKMKSAEGALISLNQNSPSAAQNSFEVPDQDSDDDALDQNLKFHPEELRKLYAHIEEWEEILVKGSLDDFRCEVTNMLIEETDPSSFQGIFKDVDAYFLFNEDLDTDSDMSSNSNDAIRNSIKKTISDTCQFLFNFIKDFPDDPNIGKIKDLHRKALGSAALMECMDCVYKRDDENTEKIESTVLTAAVDHALSRLESMIKESNDLSGEMDRLIPEMDRLISERNGLSSMPHSIAVRKKIDNIDRKIDGIDRKIGRIAKIDSMSNEIVSFFAWCLKLENNGDENEPTIHKKIAALVANSEKNGSAIYEKIADLLKFESAYDKYELLDSTGSEPPLSPD
jgi:hypothetical protein